MPMKQDSLPRAERQESSIYTNKYVRVETPAGCYIGCFQKEEKGDIYLCPCFINEPFLKNDEPIQFLRLETEVPTRICNHFPHIIQPLSEEYINRIKEKGRQILKSISEQEIKKQKITDSFYA